MAQGAAPLRRWIWLAVAWLVVATAFASTVTVWPRYQQDEGTYASQADAVLSGHLSWYTYWYDHPPLGWLSLSVPLGAVRLLTDDSVVAGRVVSSLAMATTVLLTYLVARRITSAPLLSLLAPALLLTSSLVWSFGRMVLLDVYALPFLLAGILLILDPRRRLWPIVLGCLLVGLAVLTKETFALFIPGVAVLAWQRASGFEPQVRDVLRPFIVTAGAAALVGTLVLYPLFAVLRGELLPSPDRVSLVETLLFQLGGRTGSGALWEEGSNRNELWAGWLTSDPLVAVCLLVFVLGMFSRRMRWLSIMGLAFSVPVLVGTGYAPEMHVLGMLVIGSIAVVALLDVARRSGSELIRATGLPSRASRRVSRAGAVAAGVGRVTFLLVAVALLISRADHFAEQVNPAANDSTNGAVEWLNQNTDPSQTVVVDGSILMQMSDAGWNLDRRTESAGYVVPHEKLDLDPALRLRTCDVSYLVVSPQVRSDMTALEDGQLEDVFEASEAVWESNEVQIRRVVQGCQQ